MHCHAQIEYKMLNGRTVESLIGFNPHDRNDRQLLHAMLDEFLDKHCIPHINATTTGDPDSHFKIFGELDDHAR